FDFFAHGESEGNIKDRSVSKFVDGILKAIEYVKKLGYKKIGICGTSFGGLSAVIAASKNSDLKVMALKAPGMGQSSRKLPNYKSDFETKSWIKAGESVKIPTLIVHGSEDKDVEIQFGKELSKSIKSSKLVVFEGADHRFSEKEDCEKSIKDISNFIIKNI
ncbi:MAG: prolyl oligopeptidase family serine peptidase, partial [Nanoarchaeota archaeon]|nr:prolyl oligopeptidase family serine peptidase [Nanoarchaeota archaeon]